MAQFRWGGWGLLILAAFLLVVSRPAHAQTDEIQVYTGEINPPGAFSITLHNNYTPSGRTQPAYPGAIVPGHALNGVPEFAYGVTDWWELGAYAPIYTITRDGRALLDSVKLRTLFAEPHADEKRFIYAINFEFSYNGHHWEDRRFTGEIRPILGVRFGPLDLIANPIVDYAFGSIKSLDFAPSERVAYNFSPVWALAAEHYAEFGKIRHFESGNAQGHSLFAVVDYNGQTLHQPLDVEFGIGHGFTTASDNLVLKLLLTHTF